MVSRRCSGAKNRSRTWFPRSPCSSGSRSFFSRPRGGSRGSGKRRREQQMKRAWCFPGAVLFLLSLRLSAAPEPASGDFVIRDFHFASGETLPELKIHYRPFGERRRHASATVRNAVLILHGTTGSGRAFLSDNFAGVLFGP